MTDATQLDDRLDLRIERLVDVPKELVWAAWTDPAHLPRWWAPRPYETVECEIDLRPGGIFRTVMRSPEGELYTNLCCYLEIVEHERLVWTTVLGPGYRPTGERRIPFTAVITIDPAAGGGTGYSALAMHSDADSAASHGEMGFYEGWGIAFDQLVEVARTLG